MSDELGTMFVLHEGTGELENLALRPLTKEEADDYSLATNQQCGFHKQVPPCPMAFWVPLSAFHPVRKTPAAPLTPEDLMGDPEQQHSPFSLGEQND